jgi:hypothetical protein
MQKLLSAVAAVVFLLVGSQVSAIAQSPVVVELFTSEGCSSCPPADAVLLQLSQQSAANGGEVILLGEHVDYWNYIGWTDRFSSKQFSERQSEYAKALRASVYTPQMVIDGGEQFVGNDAAEVHSRIAAAAKQPKPAQVTLTWEGTGHLQIGVHSSQAARAEVLLVITEDGLSTQVGNGENGGKTLHHAAVVRQLNPVGQLANGNLQKTVEVARKSDWNTAQLKVILLVQDPASKKILGAGSIAFAQ